MCFTDSSNSPNVGGGEDLEALSLKDAVVLIVDDEELMREVTSIMIEDHGGQVFTAVDGVHAVEVFAEHSNEINCVCMDFSMPGMDGYEAYLELEKINPGVSTIIISGLNITPEIKALKDESKVEFLSKPFHETELIKLIKDLSK